MERTIVVGYDGSPGAESALRWALSEAGRRPGASLDVVSAWAPISYAAAYYGAPGLSSTYFQDVEHDRKAALAQLTSDVRRIQAEEDATSVHVDVKLTTGGAAATLLEAARGADLLVLGTRGHGGFAGLLLGSVSQACAHHAPCPLVIIPRPAAAEAA